MSEAYYLPPGLLAQLVGSGVASSEDALEKLIEFGSDCFREGYSQGTARGLMVQNLLNDLRQAEAGRKIAAVVAEPVTVPCALTSCPHAVRDHDQGGCQLCVCVTRGAALEGSPSAPCSKSARRP